MAEALANVVEPQVDDVSADVRAAVAELKGEVQPESQNENAESATARARNERGQFAPKIESAAPDKVEPKTVPDADPSSANADTASKPVDAPKGWSAEAKADWSKLSPATQAAVLKRESEINDGGARWSEEKRALTEALTPLRDLASENKVPEGEVARRLVSAERFIREKPSEAIAWIAERSGLKVSIDGAPVKTPSQPQADPVVAQLHHKVSQFERMFEQQEQGRIGSEIESFASAPGHEHFAAVRQEMGLLMQAAIQAGRTMTLDQAYEKAVWSDPDIRTQLTASQNADAARKAKERETAERARRGSLSLNGSPNGGTRPAPKADPNASVADDVRAALAQLRH